MLPDLNGGQAMAVDFGTVIDGASRTDNINTDGTPISMEAQTALLDPGTFPLVALTDKTGSNKKTVGNMKQEFRERRLKRNYTTVTTAVTADNTTSLAVADGTLVKVDMIVAPPSTGENLLVTAVSGNTLSVTPASAGTGNIAEAIAQGAALVIMSEAHAEGEEVPAAYSVKSVNKFNYLMQSDRRIQTTDIDEATVHYDTSEDRRQDQRMGMIEYKRDQNLLFYVGEGSREVVSASGRRRHVCSGLFEQFSENNVVMPGGGAFTKSTLGEIMASTTPHSTSGTKTGLFGTNGWSKISAWPDNFMRVSPGADQRWGVTLNTVITGYGDIEVGHDPVLRTTHGLEDRAVIMDLQWIKQLQMNGLPVVLMEKVANLSSVHEIVDAITGTFGLEVKFAELHAQISNL